MAIEGLDEWEAEEAARRRAAEEKGRAKFQEKAKAEQAKVDAGIGVETPAEAAAYADDETE